MAVTTMSAGSSWPEAEQDAGQGEALDGVGHHGDSTAPDGLEEVSVGDGTKALVPGVVARGEVGVDVVPGGQLALETLAQESLHVLRIAPARGIEALGHQGVCPLRSGARLLFGQHSAEDLGQGLRCGRDAM